MTVLRSQAMGEDLFRVDAQHPALVHLAAAVVGPPDSRPGMGPMGPSSSRRRRMLALADAARHYGKRAAT